MLSFIEKVHEKWEASTISRKSIFKWEFLKLLTFIFLMAVEDVWMSALHLETVAVIDGMIEFFIDLVLQSRNILAQCKCKLYSCSKMLK